MSGDYTQVTLNCERCRATNSEGECCSSHGKQLCHQCYRRTHFVEVCVKDCAACAREGLPLVMSAGAR